MAIDAIIQPRVDRLDDVGVPAWAEYLQGRAGATFFHELCWRTAVERAFGHSSHYLLARRGPRVTGVLPLTQVDSLFGGRFLVSVAYATYGGVLADDSESARRLLHEAELLAARVGASSIEFRSESETDSALPVNDGYSAFRRELPADPREVLPWLPRKARAAVRRAAETAGLSVAFGPEHLNTVWHLYARSMRRLGSPNYPSRFFEALVAAAPDSVLVELIRVNDRPVAGLVSFLHRGTILPYFAGLDERVEIYGLHHLMYYESMCWAARNGFRRYDFGRSRVDNAGPYNFKRFCGFEPQPLQYQTYVVPGREAPNLRPNAPRWAIARRVWKHLPLTVTRPLGGWLARSIPG